jgi:hypothetical protein
MASSSYHHRRGYNPRLDDGYALQYEGERELVPFDGKVDNACEVPAQAIQISDDLQLHRRLGN